MVNTLIGIVSQLFEFSTGSTSAVKYILLDIIGRTQPVLPTNARLVLQTCIATIVFPLVHCTGSLAPYMGGDPDRNGSRGIVTTYIDETVININIFRRAKTAEYCIIMKGETTRKPSTTFSSQVLSILYTWY